MNTYIVPTVERETLARTLDSIRKEDPNAEILVCKGGSAASNRNLGLKNYTGDWIFFIDDDDFYTEGYLSEVEESLDIIIFRMKQGNRIIPRIENDSIVMGNVGINFAIRSSFYKKLNLEFENRFAEDWFFLETYLKLNPNVKITEKIYYNAPIVNHHQPK